MRYFVSRLSSLGDVVCTLPVASALKKGQPNCEVVWMVDRRFAAIVERCSAVDRVVLLPAKLGPLKVLMAELGEFDAALDMQGLLKSAVPVGLAKTKVRLGYHWRREGASFFSRPVRPDPSSLHVVDQYVDVARAAGGAADRAEFALTPTAQDLEAVRSKLEDLGGTDRPLVVINAGAGWASKRWPADKVAFVADELYRFGAQPTFIGAAADQAVIDEVLAFAREPLLSLVGQTNLGELIALIDMAKMHLGGDTGSTHVAAALGRPAFGTYIMTRPDRSCPYGQIDRCRTLDEREVAAAMIAELNRC